MLSRSNYNQDYREQTNNHKEESADSMQEDTFLPPRKVVHPTEKETWLRIFYRSLLWLFILLVAGLLVWGWRRVNGEA